MFKNIGWALPTRSNFRYTNKQKQVLFKYFMEGEESGNKMSPEEVALLRKKLLPEEYVSVQQIRSLFSRWSKLYIEGKLRPPSDEEDYETGKDDNIDHDDDWDAEQYKIDLNNVTSKLCSQWEVEDWVTIVYDKQLYPGVIADVSYSGILVDCMKGLPGKNCFRWPPKKDTPPILHKCTCTNHSMMSPLKTFYICPGYGIKLHPVRMATGVFSNLGNLGILLGWGKAKLICKI